MKLKIAGKSNFQRIVLLAFAFVLSRSVFFIAGVRFDATPIQKYIQFLDPVFIQDNFLQSLFYLSSQPPLFNFLLGTVLKLFPLHYAVVFQVLYLLMGLGLMISVFLLMIRFGVQERIALVLTFLFMINPGVILYENWLFYSYPIAFVLSFSALVLHFYLKRLCFKTGLLFFSLLAALALLRGTFHICWFVFIVFLIALQQKLFWKKIFLASLIPFIIIFSFYLKSLVLFGSFTLSPSILRIQLVEMSMRYYPREKLQQLYAEKKISEFSWLHFQGWDLPPFADSPYYQVKLTGIPILDRITTPTTGHVNFDSNVFLQFSQDTFKDFVTAIQHYPWAYFVSVAKSFFVYFLPGPTDVTFLNRDAIGVYEKYYNFPFLHLNNANSDQLYSSQLNYDYRFFSLKWDYLSFFFLACLIIFVFKLLLFGYHALRDFYEDRKQDIPKFTVFAFIYFNIIYLTLVNNFLGYWANNRYRFSIDPFLLILLGLFLTFHLQRFAKASGLSSRLRNALFFSRSSVKRLFSKSETPHN